MSFRVGTPDELGVGVDDICRFLREQWKRVLCLAHPEFYRWQFLEAPESGGKDHSAVAVDDHGRILGYLGVNSRSYRLDEKVVLSGDITTWVVHKDERGRGVGLKVLQLMEERYPIIYGNTPSKQSAPIFLKSGYKIIPALPRFVRIVNLERLVQHVDLSAPHRDLVRNTRSLSEVPPYRVREISVDQLAAGDVAIPDLHMNGPIRDIDFLVWRYGRHPVFPYRFIEVQTGSDSCLLVVRTDRSPTLKILYVLEVLGPPKTLPAVTAYLDELARQEDVDIAEFSCPADGITHVLWAAGWFSVVDDPIEIPHLFYPLEYRHPPSSGLLIWTRLPQASYWDRSRLYMTKGDIDMDRPTQAYLDAHPDPQRPW